MCSIWYVENINCSRIPFPKYFYLANTMLLMPKTCVFVPTILDFQNVSLECFVLCCLCLFSYFPGLFSHNHWFSLFLSIFPPYLKCLQITQLKIVSSKIRLSKFLAKHNSYQNIIFAQKITHQLVIIPFMNKFIFISGNLVTPVQKSGCKKRFRIDRRRKEERIRKGNLFDKTFNK